MRDFNKTMLSTKCQKAPVTEMVNIINNALKSMLYFKQIFNKVFVILNLKKIGFESQQKTRFINNKN